MDIDAITENISIALYTITVALGTVGNTVVIWVAGVCLPAKVTNVWLVNLAVANLIFCLTRAISLTKKIFFDLWPFGVFLCKFNGFFKYANMFCSAFLLAVICLDQTLCVCRPKFTKQHRTLFAARLVSVVVWVAASVMSAPYFVYREVYLGKNNLSKCSLEVKEKEGENSAKMALYTIRFLCGFLLPFLVCSALCCRLVRSKSKRTAQKPFLRILVGLVCAFFVCWAPYHCLLLVKMNDSKNQALKVGLTLAKGIAYFNSCVNPVLYFCMGLNFKQMLSGAYRPALTENQDGQITQLQEYNKVGDSSGSPLKHVEAQVHGNSAPGV
ncbi:hypothetical protein ACEWY4_023771 [Coilia grayii]|uniref:G-protein coupled receptors family 1 profile domain-containing protein n=1 Tax=Coilia grayii TaxID=363190 RepID=A0ABD1IYF5_9TELE